MTDPCRRHHRPARPAFHLVAALAVLTGVAVGGGCGTSGVQAPSAADAAYLFAVHDGAPDVASYRSDTALIRLGHAACDGFRAGASYEQLADRMSLQEGSDALPSVDLGTVITAAVQAYCPRYSGLVQ